MKDKTKSKLHTPRLQALLAAGVLVAGMGLVATAANATIVASVGGAPMGADIYETFNSCTAGSSAQCVTPVNNITVDFNPNASAVSGSSDGLYAAPFLSGGNGANFGGQPDGPDATTYLTTGSTGAFAGSSVTLSLPQVEKYMGLLWGSVDNYNTLTFYNGGLMVDQFTGTDISVLAGLGNCVGGNQGAIGTCYVNINLAAGFDKVIATSSDYAFEFDNVAFKSTTIGVPEPGTAGMFLLGLLLLGSGYWYQKRRLA